MVSTSELYDTAIQKDSRSFVCRITAGADTLTSEVNSLVQTLGSCGDDSFSIGCVFASYVDITLSAVPVLLAGRELYVEIGLRLPDGTVEYVPMGYYTASPSDIERTRGRITVKAVDRLSSKCGGLYTPSAAFPASVGQVLDDIEAQAGISVETALDTSGTVIEPMEGLLCREALGYIAGLLGGFCYADRYGVIRIAAYPKSRTAGVGAGRCLDDARMAEDGYTVGSLAVTVKTGGTDADGSEEAGVSYTEGAGEGVSVSNPYMTQELFDAMKSRVLGYTYRPGTVRFLGDPRIGPEDALEVETWAGDRYLLPCMGITHDYDGGLTTAVTAPGRASSDTSARGPLQSAVDRLLADMVLTKEVVAKKITADEAVLRFASIDSLQASNARIDTISGDLAQYRTVVAGDLAALTARIEKIVSTDITVEYLEANCAAIDMANVAHGSIQSYHIGDGQIGSAQIADASITDAKIVELTANKINAGTLSVERLEIRGSTNSLVYAINNISGALQTQNVDTLNGEVLTPRTITADKIVAGSISSDEIKAETIKAGNINLRDLFAQDIEATGTIRGLRIVGATGDFSGTVNASDGVFRGTVYASAGEFTGKVTATSGSFTGAVNATSGTFRGTVYASAGEFTGKVTATSGSFTGAVIAKALTVNKNFSDGTSFCMEVTNNAFTFWTQKSTSSAGSSLYYNSFKMVPNEGITIDSGGEGLTVECVTFINDRLIVENGITCSGSLAVAGGITCSSGRLYMSDWVQFTNTAGVYWGSYGGGWYMNDANWIRAWNDKGIHTAGTVSAAVVNVNTGGNNAYVNLGNKGAMVYAENGSGDIVFRYRTSASANFSYASVVGIMNNLSSKAAMVHSHSNYLPTSGGTVSGALSVSNNISILGTTTATGAFKNIYAYNNTTTSASNLHVNSSGTHHRSTASSRRYKHDIRPLSGGLEPSRLLSVPVVQYVYNADYLSDDDPRYGRYIPGFIAEDIAEIYPVAAETDGQGLVEDWNIRLVVPPMLALVQEGYKMLADHGARLSIAESRQDGTDSRLSDLQAQLSVAMATAARQEAEIRSLRTKLEQLQAA